MVAQLFTIIPISIVLLLISWASSSEFQQKVCNPDRSWLYKLVFQADFNLDEPKMWHDVSSKHVFWAATVGHCYFERLAEAYVLMHIRMQCILGDCYSAPENSQCSNVSEGPGRTTEVLGVLGWKWGQQQYNNSIQVVPLDSVYLHHVKSTSWSVETTRLIQLGVRT